jgi:hypothetical protein
VQMVHYPLFGRIDVATFGAYQASNTARTTVVVLPPMMIELVTALLLVVNRGHGIRSAEAWAGVLLLGVIWISTLLVQSPLHGRLQEHLDPRWVARLVTTNWLRTVLWSVRGVLVAAWLIRPPA